VPPPPYPPEALISPLSNKPVSLVTVWATASLFVQVTVVPTATVSELGLKAMPDIDTLFVPFPGGVGVGEGWVEYMVEDLLQLTRRQIANIWKGTRIKACREFFVTVFIFIGSYT
jgi:hypothetical protein